LRKNEIWKKSQEEQMKKKHAKSDSLRVFLICSHHQVAGLLPTDSCLFQE